VTFRPAASCVNANSPALPSNVDVCDLALAHLAGRSVRRAQGQRRDVHFAPGPIAEDDRVERLAFYREADVEAGLAAPAAFAERDPVVRAVDRLAVDAEPFADGEQRVPAVSSGWCRRPWARG